MHEDSCPDVKPPGSTYVKAALPSTSELICSDSQGCACMDFALAFCSSCEELNCATSAIPVEDEISTSASVAGSVCPDCLLCKECAGIMCVPSSNLCNDKSCFVPSSSPSALRTNGAWSICSCKERFGKDKGCGCCYTRQSVYMMPVIRCRAAAMKSYQDVENISISNLNLSCFCKYPEGHSAKKQSVTCSCPSQSQNLSKIPGAFCQDGSSKLSTDFKGNSVIPRSLVRNKSWKWNSCGIIDPLWRIKINWKSLLMLAFLLPCVFSRGENF